MAEHDLTMLGPCGICCDTCDIHVAHKTGNVAKQTEIAEWIEKHCDTEVSPERIRCDGCRGPRDAHWSADCRVLACANARGVTTCAACGEFETCTTLESFYRSGEYRSAKGNLLTIRDIGFDEWMKERETAKTG